MNCPECGARTEYDGSGGFYYCPDCDWEEDIFGPDAFDDDDDDIDDGWD